MHTQYIPLADLHVSPLNMRAEKKEPSLQRMTTIAADLLPSIREKGVLQDLIVRPNGQGFEIVAGRRRYYGARVIEQERGNFDPLSCRVIEAGDDAEALEISVIENVAREDVDPLSQYENYARLIRLGRTPAQIALSFGITEKEVRQRLALANLLPRLRDAYRAELINAGEIQILTLASKSQQREFLTLLDEHNAPRGSYLRDWLFGGDAISTRHALFPLENYKGEIVTDLFGEEGFFKDKDTFWELQDQAIAARRDTYLAAKWADVAILERGARFEAWNFVKARKSASGRVYIVAAASGEVTIHEGYISHTEARKAHAKSEQTAEHGRVGEAGQAAKSPATNKMRNYIELHQHAAARLALLANPDMALRLLVAHAIASTGNWMVRPDTQRAEGKDVKDSLLASEAQKLFEAERDSVAAILEADAGKKDTEEDSDLPESLSGRCTSNDDTVRVFNKLATLAPDEFLRIASFIMAETLAVGSPATQMVGHTASVDLLVHWSPDDVFFNLIRDRDSLNKMLTEVAGEKVARKHVSAKAKDQRTALARAAADQPTWCPDWMKFDHADR